ncbi:MAG: cupin domain-containing protein [Oscillatoriales cyanobacterium RM2_1_1]|nr:cupin domain-containing protein [Oscillatoriales cyanobacterium SM2_3_0]NJO45237.1 cupin domain-containing protein [Oscillatoriales cyanobacterium RM2_1_1]
MAILQLEDGTIYTHAEDIMPRLAALNVNLQEWPIENNAQLCALIDQETLTELEKQQVLEGLDFYFQQLQQSAGYEARDLIVLHPELPDLRIILNKFEQCHTHADDEVRYIIDGEGIFGFVCPDGSQIELTVQPEEYINVPAGTEHWFHLTEAKRVKAIRYFTSTAGWTPEYTGSPVRFSMVSDSSFMTNLVNLA